MAQERRICPSSRAEEGALLIGVAGAMGKVSLLPQPLPVDQEFIQIASRNGRILENRFRFAGECVQGACRQWKTGACGVIESVLNRTPTTVEEPLRECAIRDGCRWYFQRGASACGVCTEVITAVPQIDPASLFVEEGASLPEDVSLPGG